MLIFFVFLGKTYLLGFFASKLVQQKVDYRVTTFSGLMANQLSTSTLFYLLGIYDVQKTTQNLIDLPICQRVINDFSKVTYLLLDELSLVGARLFFVISERLKRIKKSSKPFGGVHIFASADFSQVCTFGDIPLFRSPESVTCNYAKSGLLLYQQANCQLTLTQPVRQADDVRYYELLTRIRGKEATEEDLALLKSRLASNLRDEEKLSFKNSLHIFSSNAEIDNYNNSYVESLGKPIKLVKAEMEPECKFCLSNYRPFYIPGGHSIQATITRNINYFLGLANGTTVEIIEAYYQGNAKMPAFIKIKTDSFKGIGLDGTKDTITIAPIQEKLFCVHDRKYVTVKHYPLRLCYATSFFRVQGLNLEKAVVDLSGHYSYDRRSYTGITRIKKLENLMLMCKNPLESVFPPI